MKVTLTNEKYRKLKSGEKLEKDGHTYIHLARLGGKIVTIAEMEGDKIGAHRRGATCKVTACKIKQDMLQYPRKGLWQ